MLLDTLPAHHPPCAGTPPDAAYLRAGPPLRPPARRRTRGKERTLSRHVSAGVIVCRRDAAGCLFLMLRSRLTRRPLWEFPKGGVDPGEDVRSAALRELREETGFDSADIRIVPGFECTEDYHFTSLREGRRVIVRKHVTYLLAEARHDRVRLSAHEATDFAWLGLPEATRRCRYPARRRMLEAAARHLRCDAGEPTQSDATSRSRDVSVRSGSDSA